MPAVVTKPKAAPLSPEQEALRRATEELNASSGNYSKDLLASGSIRDAIARAVSDADPSLTQLRTSQADVNKRLGTVYSDSIPELEGITDPRLREQIRSQRSAEFGSEASKLGGLISDKRGTQDQTVDRLAGVYSAKTAAEQFSVEQKRAALERAVQAENTRQSRQFDSRFDDLTRREKEASIAASERSNRGGGGAGNVIDFQEAVKNPLLEFLSKGGKRVQDSGGGYQFYGPDGKAISVDEAAGMTTAGTKADFLAGSTNKADAAFSGAKPPSPAAKQQQINAASGTQSLAQLENLLNGGISTKDMLTSKTGLTTLFASSKAKQYRDAARNVADMVARLRTGAQINEKEMGLYLQFIPGPSDDAATRKQKLDTLKTIFSAGQQGGDLSPDVFSGTVVDTGV